MASLGGTTRLPLIPAELPPEVDEKIQNVADEWRVEAGLTERPEQVYWEWTPAGEARENRYKQLPKTTPEVHVRSHFRREHTATWCPVDPARSPWHEVWASATSEPLDHATMQSVLEEEQRRIAEYCWKEQEERRKLPIWKVKNELVHAIRTSQVTLIAAETGSGKSTQVPQFILDDAVEKGEGVYHHVVCTQPRRLAAIALAERVEQERGCRYSGAWTAFNSAASPHRSRSVGSVVRWQERPPRPWGSICYCTVGALLPRLDQLGASHIIVDEAHTRDIHTDLLMAVLKTLLKTEKQVKVVVMSATFDVQRWKNYFGAEDGCSVAVVEASGRPYSVQTYFLEDLVEKLAWRPKAHDQEGKEGNNRRLPPGAWDRTNCNLAFDGKQNGVQVYSQATVHTVRGLDEASIQLPLIASVLHWVLTWPNRGGVLVFLPGWQEIGQCADLLMSDATLKQCYEIVKLHSSVPPQEQAKAMRPASPGFQKVILSTDIAETSITVPDIVCVVDSAVGRVKVRTALELQWVSQGNIMQRRGRAGRVQEGVSIHLCTKMRFDLLPKEPVPEMLRVGLDEVVLTVCDLGLDRGDEWKLRAYTFLQDAPDPPRWRDVEEAYRVLKQVGAMDDEGWITHLGAILVRLPLAPSDAAALFLGALLRVPCAASVVLAAATSREPWARSRSHGEMDDTVVETAASFAIGCEDASGNPEEPIFSDVFAIANALCQFEMEYLKRDGSDHRFCKRRNLNHLVMVQMLEAKCQLWRHLRDLGFDVMAEQDVPPGQNLRRAWPLMQTMLIFANGDHLGVTSGGRKVQAGYQRDARLTRASVMVASKNPKQVVIYGEMGTGSGGAVLNSATAVSPHQALLFGDPVSAGFKALDNCANLGSRCWLDIPCTERTAVALGALRAVTRKVLQWSAKEACSLFRDITGESETETRPEYRGRRNLVAEVIRQWTQSWQECVSAVASLPPPEDAWDAVRCDPDSIVAGPNVKEDDPLPLLALTWDAMATTTAMTAPTNPFTVPTPAPALAVPAAAAAAAAWSNWAPACSWDYPASSSSSPSKQTVQSQSSTAVVSQDAWDDMSPELAIGWTTATTEDGRHYYWISHSEDISQWEHPRDHAEDGSAKHWRWTVDTSLIPVMRRYVQVVEDPVSFKQTQLHVQEHPPRVGDGQVMPIGWSCAWHGPQKRHWYFHMQSGVFQWEFPISEAPSKSAG